MTESVADRFRVLHVCYANECRSPMAERLTLASLAAAGRDAVGHVVTASAGVRAVPGRRMHRYAMAELLRRGADPSGFRSRRLDRAMVDQAHLVLAAGSAERDLLLWDFPQAIDRVFTLLEFARLAGAVVPATVGAAGSGPDVSTGRTSAAIDLVARARAARGLVRIQSEDADELVDPQRTPEAFYACAAMVANAAERLVAALRLV